MSGGGIDTALVSELLTQMTKQSPLLAFPGTLAGNRKHKNPGERAG